MIFDDLTRDVTYEALQRYLQMQDNRSSADLETAGQLYDNTTNPDIPPTMGKDLADEYRDTWTPIPVGRLITQKISNGMYGRTVQRTTGSKEMDKQWEALFDKMAVQAPVACRACSAYGDGAIRIVRNYRGLILSLYTGKQITPIYDPDAPEDQPVGMIYEYDMQTIDNQIAARLKRQEIRTVRVQEVITRHQRDLDGNIVLPGIRAKFVEQERVPYAENDPGLNPYGDFLDCSYWRNSLEIHSHRGESDIIPLQKLLSQLNHTVTDAKIFLKWNQWPTLYTTAAKDKQNPIPYHWRAMNYLGDAADGSPATMGKIDMNAEQIGGYIQFMEYLMSMISVTGRVPAVSLGDISNVGQLSSGRAYEIAMTPLIDMINERTPIFRAQEIDLMYVCRAVMARRDDEAALMSTVPCEGEYLTPDWQKIHEQMQNANVEFGPMSLAKSPMEDAQVHSIRIAAGYESEKTAVEATHPEWDEKQVQEELDLIGAGAVQNLDRSAQARVSAMRQAMGVTEEADDGAAQS